MKKQNLRALQNLPEEDEQDEEDELEERGEAKPRGIVLHLILLSMLGKAQQRELYEHVGTDRAELQEVTL